MNEPDPQPLPYMIEIGLTKIYSASPMHVVPQEPRGTGFAIEHASGVLFQGGVIINSPRE